MDWQRIMSEAGVPDSPGRKEVVEKMTTLKPYKATYRDKRTGLSRTEQIMATSFKDALKQAQNGCGKLQSLLEDW